MGRSPRALLGLAVAASAAVVGVVGAAGLSGAPALPNVSIADATGTERAGGSVMSFTLTLNARSSARVTVRFATVGGTATPGADYVRASGVVAFSPGARTRRLAIRVRDDGAKEAQETIRVRLSAPRNATVGRAVAIGTIADDDGAGEIVTIAAAGDIACEPGKDPRSDKCAHRATSDLLAAGRYAAVLTLGDNQYPDGELADFKEAYDPTWGRVKAVTRPSPGNHDYHVAGAAGYFDYFGAVAGDRAKGYYSYDLGAWHLISLNSNCSDVACDEGSEQERWLRADLQAAKSRCVLAYWHHPRFSSGEVHGSSSSPAALYQALYDHRADVILWGHEHNYERFGPTDPRGRLDTARGIRLFVVGTGGKSHYAFADPLPTSEKRDDTSFGILELRLGAGRYDWQFRPAVGSFTDSGSDVCR